jgi:hypothetical protein
MMVQSRYNGFASLDALIGMLPVLLLLFLAMDAAAAATMRAQEASHRQQAFDRIVSAADYTVKTGAARHEAGVRYPNWLDEEAITPEYVESLRAREGLSSLYIGTHEPREDYPMCIYRLFVSGEGREIGKLHVCGG